MRRNFAFKADEFEYDFVVFWFTLFYCELTNAALAKTELI